MSRKTHIDDILRLLPKDGRDTAEVRRRLERESARTLREMRIGLKSAANQKPHPKFEKAERQVRNLSSFSKLLRDWDNLNALSGEFMQRLR